MNKHIQKMFYAFIVTAIMFSASANAQIVYTDVIPDKTIICATGSCYQLDSLDLNNDGIIDFLIQVSSTGGVCNGTPFSRTYKRVYVTARNANKVMLNMMGINETIGSNLAFSDSTGTLSARSFSQSRTCTSSSGSWTSTSDGYLGLQITDGANNYYGWVRLNVFVTTSSVYFTEKDYAYNSIPNQPILAGQTIATGINENSFASSIQLFPNPASVHLTIDLGSSNKNVDVAIIDITGKIIYTTTSNEKNKIEVNTQQFAEGIYIVQIQTADFIITKKLIIEK